jgi:hypothetical protein
MLTIGNETHELTVGLNFVGRSDESDVKITASGVSQLHAVIGILSYYMILID